MKLKQGEVVAKKKGTKVFQRLMNVLTIGVGLITLLALNDPPLGIDKLIIIALGWGIIILAPNYIIFKKLTIWHKD